MLYARVYRRIRCTLLGQDDNIMCMQATVYEYRGNYMYVCLDVVLLHLRMLVIEGA
jgi:hypothetical protein